MEICQIGTEDLGAVVVTIMAALLYVASLTLAVVTVKTLALVTVCTIHVSLRSVSPVVPVTVIAFPTAKPWLGIVTVPVLELTTILVNVLAATENVDLVAGYGVRQTYSRLLLPS